MDKRYPQDRGQRFLSKKDLFYGLSLHEEKYVRSKSI
jgi:hypothetical protein